jgi:hypothetical protein
MPSGNRRLQSNEKNRLLPRGLNVSLDSKDDIPYLFCVLGGNSTTRGSGADVQGESLKGARAGFGKLRCSSPRVVTYLLEHRLSATLRQLPTMEHQVPYTISDLVVAPNSPRRHQFVPLHVREVLIAPMAGVCAGSAPSHPRSALQL